MSLLQTNNPVFNSTAFGQSMTWDEFHGGGAGRDVPAARPATMTIGGTINTTLILLGMTVAAAIGGWMWMGHNPAVLFPLWIVSVIICLGAHFAVVKLPNWAPYLAPGFAIGEGLFVGAVSMLYANHFGKNPGGPMMVLQAVVLTFGIAFAMLLAYKFKVIRATPLLAKVLMVGTAGVFVVFLAQLVLSTFMGIQMPYLWDGGPIAIGFSLLVVGLASFSLIMDFNFIEEGAAKGLPKNYEWVGAFGLLMTLVWLYLTILRLLAMLRRE